MAVSVTKKLFIILVTMITCVGCDQSTKYTAKYFLEGRETISMFGDALRFGYVENIGGFLSFGASLPDHARTIIFLLLTPLILAGFLIYTISSKKVEKSMILASALVISGGLGNLIDRIFNNGAVIDFINIGIGSLRTGVFNVADMAVMLGAFILILFTRESYYKKNTADR